MTSSLLLNQPLPLSDIQLGRLVRDPLYPDDDFHQPAFPAIPNHEDDAEGGAMSAPPAAAVVEHKLDNLSDTLRKSRGTRLEAMLLQALRLSWQVSDAQTRATVAAQRGAIRQLRNPHAFFDMACRDDNVRAWIEEQAQRPSYWRRRGDDGSCGIYLVCGLQTMTDARVGLAATQRSGGGVAFTVPLAAAAGAPLLAGLGLDIGAEAQVGKDSAREAAYTTRGEYVYAVQYRKIRFARFSTRSADSAYLEKGNHWKSYLVDRADEDDEDDDGVSAEVAEPLEADDLEGSAFSSLNINGNEIIYEVDDDDEG